MGGKSPKAPDPKKVAGAQGAWDLASANQSAVLGNANTVNPYGSSNYSVSGYETITTPDGKQVQVPRYTQTTTLSQPMQKQFDDRNALIDQLFGKASSGQTGYGVANLDTNFLRPDEATMATDRSRVERAIMDRANPLLNQNRESEVARLAAMGLAPGSEKYGRVSDQFERSANDLALAAVGAGGQEQSRLLDLYNRGTAASNEAKTTQTNLNMSARQSLINELLGMLGMQQPGAQPQTQYRGVGVSSPDYAGMVQGKYGQDVEKYNNRQSGIMGLIGAGLGMI